MRALGSEMFNAALQSLVMVCWRLKNKFFKYFARLFSGSAILLSNLCS